MAFRSLPTQQWPYYVPVVAEELDFVVGVDGVHGVGRSRHSHIDGLCICLIDAMSEIVALLCTYTMMSLSIWI